MSLSHSESLMQAVLDGEATAAQRAGLDRLLLTDPVAHTRFASLQRACAELDAVPEVDPPAGLADAVLARAAMLLEGRVPAAQSRESHTMRALADTRSVFPVKDQWFRGFVHLLKEIGMSEQKQSFLGTNKGRILAIASVAAVGLVGLSTVIEFPKGGSTTSGTIVPAERHRAPQNTAEDIKVGFPGDVNAGASGSALAGSVGAAAAAQSAEGQAAARVQAAADGQSAGRMHMGTAQAESAARVQAAAESQAAGRLHMGTAQAESAARVQAAAESQAAGRLHMGTAQAESAGRVATGRAEAQANMKANAAASDAANARANMKANAAASDAANARANMKSQ